MHPSQVIMEPIVTEKGFGTRVNSCYSFYVHPKATKVQVSQAIKQIYKVEVKAVNTSRVRPKRKVMGRSVGTTSQRKKAYVTLVAGQKIEELES